MGLRQGTYITTEAKNYAKSAPFSAPSARRDLVLMTEKEPRNF